MEIIDKKGTRKEEEAKGINEKTKGGKKGKI